jgi:hypothetical protein
MTTTLDIVDRQKFLQAQRFKESSLVREKKVRVNSARIIN